MVDRETIFKIENVLSININNILSIYPYGSTVYGVSTVESDTDYIVVTNNKFEYNGIKFTIGNVDILVYSERYFLDRLKEEEIFALECIYLPSHLTFNNDFSILHTVNKKLLRESISRKASNSWVKCKKKLEIEKQYYIGKKSLFHSFRILNFGIQIASCGIIYDYTNCNHLWEEIVENPINDWIYYKDTYKKKHNELSTQFKQLTPK